MHLDRLFQRLFPISQTRTARRRGEHRLTSPARSCRRTMQVESLEERRVLTVLYVANDADFTDAANPGSPQANDSVTWNGGGQFTAPVSGLIFGVNAFDSINAAVVAASNGDTIEVAPGTYSESVDVNKSITLLGAQNGVDASAGRTGASESVLDATANTGKTQFVIGADDVTIDGFTIENETNTNDFGAGIYIQPGHHGTHVVNDIVENNQIGLFLANDSNTDQAVVQHNLFQDNNQTGPGSGTGIYLDQFTAGGAVSDVLIDSNAFVGNSTAGVGMSSTSSTAVTSNIIVSNNVFDSNGEGIYAFETQNSQITNNTIENSTGSGIGLFGDDSGITISGNNITNSDTSNNGSAGIEIGSYNDATPNSNITITGNSITSPQGNNLQLDPSTASGATAAAYTGTLDATLNWWGTNDATTINGLISGNVDFSPYLDSGVNSIVSGPGFQGDLTHLDVTSLGQQVGNVGPIEQAILAAPAGGTVTIQAGTYSEDDVVIDKNLTLQGTGAVVLQAPVNSQGTGITITGDPQTVTISDFLVEGFNSSLTDSGGNTLNLTDVTLRMSANVASVGPTSSISNVTNLNLTSTSNAPQAVYVGSSGSLESLDGGEIDFSGSDGIGIWGDSNLSLVTGTGADTFNISPRADMAITVDGGDPTPPATPGDSLNMDLFGTTGTNLLITQNASGFTGSWSFTNAGTVKFSDIETISPNTVMANGNGQTITATEGENTGNQVVATFTDPANLPLADYSADINWGDGTSSVGSIAFNASSGVYSVIGSHTYAEKGTDQIAVTVHRTGAPDATLDATATVVEAPLVEATLPPVSVAYFARTPASIDVGAFTHDANTEPVSDFTATIDWGDGTSSAGMISFSNGVYIVGGTHTYAHSGEYSVTAVVTDTPGGVSLPLSRSISVGQAVLPIGIPQTANNEFISEVYNDLLHRPADAVGLTYWSAQLDAGASRDQVVAGIENTDEYRHVVINALFEQYLGRPADAGALSSFNDFLKAGGTDEDVAIIITSSSEFFADAGGTNAAFLNSLFEDALHRPIDAPSEASFEQDLANGMTRLQIAAIVFSSHEYHVDVVDELYIDLLDRPADASGESFWSAQLDHGATDEQVIQGLAGSDEYFAKASS